MANELVHVGAQGTCPHGGQLSVTSTNQRVKVGGQPVAVLDDTYTIAACPFQVPVGAGTKPQPCVKVQWVVPATRVRVNNQPVILSTSTGLCLSAEQIPQGVPTVSMTQVRVRGQ